MGGKIKVGHVVSFGVGGADKCALNLIKGLLEINNGEFEHVVFYNDYSHPRQDELDSNPTRFGEYGELPIDVIHFSTVLELKSHNLDILQTHRSGNDGWFLPHFDEENFDFKIIETNFHGYNQSKSDMRVYPSKAILGHLQPCTIPYRVIPNPILTKVTDLDLRGELDLKDKFVYGRIARPDTNIYIDTNLRAYKNIETDDTCFLYVAPCNQARVDAEALGIKNIIFLEPTSDELMVSKIYNTFDVLCHSNLLGETFGNTIAEAMINGKPIITHIGRPSWTQAHKELVGEKQELFLTENIVESYSTLMLKLKNDKEYYDETSTYLEDRAITLYDYVSVSREYNNLYKEILGQC